MNKAKIGDVCDILDSQRIPITAHERVKGIYPYYGANGVQDYVNDYIFDDELVLVAEDGGYFGSKTKPIAYRVSGKCWVNNHAHVLKPKLGLDVDYLGYSLMFCDVSKIVSGATRLKLTQSALRKIEIPLPLLAEQKRIAAALDTMSSVISRRKRQIELLYEAAKSLFVEMFGDPVENPMGWDTVTVVDVCESIVGGGTPSKSHDEYYKGDIPWVTPKDMKSIIISDSKDHITEEAIRNSTTKLVPKDTVLMVVRSGILKHTLPVAITSRDVTLNQDMKAYITNEKTSPLYLLYFFKTMERKLLHKVKGTTADNLDFGMLKKLPYPLPPLDLQNLFAARIEALEAERASCERGLSEMEMAFSAMMQEYFG